MHYHIILTELCNSQCRYCYGKSMCEENDLNKRFKFDFDAPYISEVDISKLRKFLSRDKSPVLVFYGGEPLLQMDKIKQIIDAVGDVKGIKFRMQTNAKIIDKLPIEYLKRIGKILVSVDGTKERTDFNRGEGTYDKVIGNLLRVREQGYEGEIVARMCVSERPDVYEQVMHLVGLIRMEKRVRFAHKLLHQPPRAEEVSGSHKIEDDLHGIFDSIHWQLDMGMYSCDYDYDKVKKFVEEYNASLSRLLDWWVSEISEGRVWKIYPFFGVFENLYYHQEAKLMCGAGHSGYAITTDGHLVACPIMGCMPDFYCGDLDSRPEKLRKIGVGEPCSSCEYLGNCGGRCLYGNQMKLWPPEGQDLICKTVKHLIDLMKAKMDEIGDLIESGVVSDKDFLYEKYFGPEIIP